VVFDWDDAVAAGEEDLRVWNRRHRGDSSALDSQTPECVHTPRATAVKPGLDVPLCPALAVCTTARNCERITSVPERPPDSAMTFGEVSGLAYWCDAFCSFHQGLAVLWFSNLAISCLIVRCNDDRLN
jgi:hypothetical protein